MWVFFFLNKNKPKGTLGIVVPAASLACAAPEGYGRVKPLDHTSRHAQGPPSPPSPRFGPSSVRNWAESRDVRELAGPGGFWEGCWEGAVAGRPLPPLTPSAPLAARRPSRGG